MATSPAVGAGAKSEDEEHFGAPLGEWKPLAGANGWSFRPRTAFDHQYRFFEPGLLADKVDSLGLTWMAADVATSIELSKGRYLWLFGDTFVGLNPKKPAWRNKGGFVAFPRQTVGIAHMTREGRRSSGEPFPSSLRFVWGRTPSVPGKKIVDPAQTVANMFDPSPNVLLSLPGASAKPARELASEGGSTATTTTATTTTSSSSSPPETATAAPSSASTATAEADLPPPPPQPEGLSSAASLAAEVESQTINMSLVPGAESVGIDTNLHVGPWYWVITGVRPHLRGPLLLLASTVEFKPGTELGFGVSCTGAITVTNPDAEPEEWVYKQVVVPGTREDLNWYSGVAFSDGWVYLIGVIGNGLDSKQTLARLPVDEAMALDFSHMEVWALTKPKASSKAKPADPHWLSYSKYLEDEKLGDRRKHDLVCLLGPGSIGTTELSMMYEPRIGLWVMSTLYAFDEKILIWTATSPTGPWRQSEALDTAAFARMETAFQKRVGASEQKKRMYYSAKIHPELSRGDDIVITYCANVLGDWPAPIDYTPRFFRLQIRHDEEAEAPAGASASATERKAL